MSSFEWVWSADIILQPYHEDLPTTLELGKLFPVPCWGSAEWRCVGATRLFTELGQWPSLLVGVCDPPLFVFVHTLSRSLGVLRVRVWRMRLRMFGVLSDVRLSLGFLTVVALSSVPPL